MGSINKSHNESDGGVVLFAGELILIYCDAVTCEIGGKESVKGRIYLTTHRIIFIAAPLKQNSTVKSFCAPFFALTNISLEQPVFGANYIKSSVKDEADHSQSFTFKLKFYKGGAIEFARAMDQAAAAVSRMNPNPPAYTPTPGNTQYYQAPPSVYAPGYNCGFQMPTQQFPEQPPIGFIYASAAPPPYPGMTPQPPPTTLPSSVPPYQQGAYSQSGQGLPSGYGQPGQYPGQQQQPGQYPGQQPPPYSPGAGYPGHQGSHGQPQQHAPGYPAQAPASNQSGYPGQAPPAGQAGYPGQAPPAGQPGYPGQAPPAGQPGYPGQAPPAGQPGYPGQAPPAGQPGYPGQAPPAGQAGYPGQAPTANQSQYPGYPGPASQPSGPTQSSTAQPAYPNLSQLSNNASAPQDWPSAPSFNPNWQEEKKSQ